MNQDTANWKKSIDEAFETGFRAAINVAPTRQRPPCLIARFFSAFRIK